MRLVTISICLLVLLGFGLGGQAEPGLSLRIYNDSSVLISRIVVYYAGSKTYSRNLLLTELPPKSFVYLKIGLGQSYLLAYCRLGTELLEVGKKVENSRADQSIDWVITDADLAESVNNFLKK